MRAAILVVLLALRGGIAAAEPLAVDACPPATGTDAERRARAGAAYDRGDVRYLQGDYAGAIDAFVESYCTLPYYTVLKDVGQAYERLLEYERAIAYLERYVASIPDGAKRPSACAPEPAEDRANVAARVKVLAGLPAKLSVATSPPGAALTLRRGATVVARGRAGDGVLEARAGAYEITLELDGYVPVTQPLTVEIGKPYSYYVQLAPRRGRLRVRAVPADARVFVDRRFVGVGGVDEDLPGGRYEVTVEAPGRLPERRLALITADATTTLTVRLAEPAASGRGELLAATTIGGGLLGGVALGAASGDGALGALGAAAGLGLGVAGGYFGIARDVPVGDSSLIINTALIGAGEGALLAGLIGDVGPDDDAGGLAGTVGLVLGAAGGTLAAQRLALSAGDAALLGSGALWGAAIGGLFSTAFEGGRQVSSAITLAGLNAGVLTGALLGRGFEASRRHVALIDLAGVGGAIAATAVQSLVDDGETVSPESRAHYTIAGVGVGLLAGAYLTRNLDARPAAPARPSVTPTPGGLLLTLGGEL